MTLMRHISNKSHIDLYRQNAKLTFRLKIFVLHFLYIYLILYNKSATNIQIILQKYFYTKTLCFFLYIFQIKKNYFKIYFKTLYE